jgi:isopentenyl phosphate kinase
VKDLVIIKLGGSVITDKNKKRSFNKKVARRLIGEIASAQNKLNFNLIIAHGSGSFGHPVAAKYKVQEGFKNKKSLRGFTLTKEAVYDLATKFFVEASKEINCAIVQLSDVTVATERKIVKFNTDSVEQLLGLGMVPVLYGDVVFDNKIGFSIVSADAIVSFLAKKLNAKKVIFVSDVDGVFDKNPKVYKDAKLIREINLTNFNEVISRLEGFNKKDVTGEMKGKLLSMKNELKEIDTRIIGGFLPGALKKVLLGANLGTRIVF